MQCTHAAVREWVQQPIGQTPVRLSAALGRAEPTPIIEFIQQVQKARTGAELSAASKVVFSSTLEEPEWTNSTVIDGDVADEVSKLKQTLDGDIVVHGSRQLVQTLVEQDLVDELRLMVFPVVLGSGKRLFEDGSDQKALELVDSKTFSTGVLYLTYQPAQS